MRSPRNAWMLVLLGACAAPPVERGAPVVRIAVEVTPGLALTGLLPRDQTPPADEAPRDLAAARDVAHLLTIRCTSVPEPLVGLDALGAHALTVVRRFDEHPIGGRPTVLPRLGVAGPAQTDEVVRRQTAWDVVASAQAVVLPGAATTLRVDAPALASFALRLTQPSSASAICVLESPLPDGRSELVLLDVVLKPGAAPLVLHLPATDEALGFVAVVGLATDAPPDELVEQALAALRASTAADADRTAALSADPAQRLLQTQVAQFERSIGARQRRPALVALAEDAGASRCADLAVVADDEALIAVAAELPDDFAARDAAARRLLLERAAFAALLPRLQLAQLPPRLYSWLARHGGASGTNPASLGYVLDEATDLAALERLLLDENLEELSSVDPGTRVLAVWWLRIHGIEVPGFDALAERDERRRALRAFEQQRAGETPK